MQLQSPWAKESKALKSNGSNLRRAILANEIISKIIKNTNKYLLHNLTLYFFLQLFFYEGAWQSCSTNQPSQCSFIGTLCTRPAAKSKISARALTLCKDNHQYLTTPGIYPFDSEINFLAQGDCLPVVIHSEPFGCGTWKVPLQNRQSSILKPWHKNLRTTKNNFF